MEAKCRALSVKPDDREKLWNSYFGPNKAMSLRHLQYSWSGFNNDENVDEVSPYWNKWFEVI